MDPDTAIRIIVSLIAHLDKQETFHGQFSLNLAKAKDQMSVLRDSAETSSTSTLQKDVILYLAQSI